VEAEERDRETFSGAPGVIYDVTIRIRRVVEPKNFTGGTVEPEHFPSGGTPRRQQLQFLPLEGLRPAPGLHRQPPREKVGHFLFAIERFAA
jgi:hypothetical protein